MEAILVDYFDQLADPFFNPQKRVFLGYLLGSAAIALIVQCVLARTKFGGVYVTFFRQAYGGLNLLAVTT